MSGLRYDSLADMPKRMQQQVAVKIMTAPANAASVLGNSQKAAKYRNKKTIINGIAFDSQKEARRYEVLMDAVREGVISDLRLQQNFTLQEGYTTPEGVRIQAIVYQADFSYTVCWRGEFMPTGVPLDDLIYWRAHPGERVIEDVKTTATRTRVYINKYKMMADRGNTIREV